MFNKIFGFADKNNLYDLAWPVSRLGEAIELLGRKVNFLPKAVAVPIPPDNLTPELMGQWIEAATRQIGLEAEAVETNYGEIDQLIQQSAPALLCLPPQNETEPPRFLVILKGGKWWLSLITSDLSTRRVKPQVIRNLLCEPLETPLNERIDQLLKSADIPEHRQKSVRAAIMGEWLGQIRLGGCWLVRLSPSVDIWQQFKQVGLRRYVGLLVGAHIIWQLLQIFSWWVIGRGALQGHFEWIWLQVWGLVLLTAVPIQLLTLWSQNQIVAKTGLIFKQRLLYGALQLQADEVRHQGAGQFLGRVMESDALELLALSGGFMGIIALIELGMAAMILATGVGGVWHALLLVLWTGFILLLGWIYWRDSFDWKEVYRHMTNDLVERMVGHRTRLAQENRRQWHVEEDKILARYFNLSTRLDQPNLQTAAQVWLILGLAGIAYTFVVKPNQFTELAISLGGIMLAAQAFTILIEGMQGIVGVMTAWQQVSPLLQAANRPIAPVGQKMELPVPPPTDVSSATPTPLLAVRDLTFRYREHSRAVLEDCNLRIMQGDRLLLEGSSGGGKSTLAAILAGLRIPQTGLLLWRGFDWQTIGLTEWRRHVVSAPQFHENHVLTETFAFNLLMGRTWPPSAEDLTEAETVCDELGLSDLLARMPAGLQQMVGESGWQLSHGERSRLYIARAILQKADLIMLDESFAALDPENLQRALQCVLNRAPTLLVIAHP